MNDEYDFNKAKRGAVLKTPAGKTRITIRIDDDVLDWFRKAVHEAGGGNYQTLINEALRQHVENEREALEDTLRRVLREVLPRSTSEQRVKRGAKKKASKKKPGIARTKVKPKKKATAKRKRA